MYRKHNFSSLGFCKYLLNTCPPKEQQQQQIQPDSWPYTPLRKRSRPQPNDVSTSSSPPIIFTPLRDVCLAFGNLLSHRFRVQTSLKTGKSYYFGPNTRWKLVIMRQDSYILIEKKWSFSGKRKKKQNKFLFLPTFLPTYAFAARNCDCGYNFGRTPEKRSSNALSIKTC